MNHIALVIVNKHLVHTGRIEEFVEYLSQILAPIQFWLFLNNSALPVPLETKSVRILNAGLWSLFQRLVTVFRISGQP